MIDERTRWAHPTVADVAGKLNIAHCDECIFYGELLEAFFTHGNDAIMANLDTIGRHIWEEYK